MAFVEIDVSDKSRAALRSGYLLLRDGHAVPLQGISPEDIKAGAKNIFPNPEADPVRHRQCLTAIVDRLGFRGDFGTFQQKHWPEFQNFLIKNRCTHRAGVFPLDHGGSIDLFFGKHFGPRPRQLADRIFANPDTRPDRVFLGYGVNWAAWDSGNGIHVPSEAVTATGNDAATAYRLARDLFACRHDLAGQWGFLDDKLVDGPVRNVVDKTYWPPGTAGAERSAGLRKIAAAVQAFRAVFDGSPDGWIEVLPYNDRLVVLRARNGGWDLLWRNYREKEPPAGAAPGNPDGPGVEDMPSCLITAADLRRLLYLRQDAWEEWEAHAAGQAFYNRAGSISERQNAADVEVMAAWLREQGQLPSPGSRRRDYALPQGFSIVVLHGRRVAVSAMVTVGSFRKMLLASGYAGRRPASDEPWERANGGASDAMPVGASWSDAQAFCAWMERENGVMLRLPTRAELRALRPAFSSHYGRLAGRDFPWEHFPPRPLAGASGPGHPQEVPSAVSWSEPRFLEHQPGRPEFPTDSGLATGSRRRWITDFPPHATWKSPMPLAKHGGLDFIDAWDACEWCQEKGWVSGRFWEGQAGANSWGAYKNMKITFRVLIDLEE